MLSRPTGREGALGGGDGLVDLGAAAQRNDAAALAGRRIEDRRRAGKKRCEHKGIEAGIRWATEEYLLSAMAQQRTLSNHALAKPGMAA
jgi:hypothetical protein